MIRTDVSVPITLALKQAGCCITDEELPLKPTKAEDCIFFLIFFPLNICWVIQCYTIEQAYNYSKQ